MTVKLANYFLVEEDERSFSAELRTLFPSLVFVDDQLWDTAVPPTRANISECSSGLAYLWWRDLTPHLPSVLQSNGRYRGPATGCVLQLPRCRVRGDRLLMGQMRVYLEAYESNLCEAVQTVFRTLHRKYRSSDSRYLVGAYAAAQVRRGMKLAISEQSVLTVS